MYLSTSEDMNNFRLNKTDIIYMSLVKGVPAEEEDEQCLLVLKNLKGIFNKVYKAWSQKWVKILYLYNEKMGPFTPFPFIFTKELPLPKHNGMV